MSCGTRKTVSAGRSICGSSVVGSAPQRAGAGAVCCEDADTKSVHGLADGDEQSREKKTKSEREQELIDEISELRRKLENVSVCRRATGTTY